VRQRTLTIGAHQYYTSSLVFSTKYEEGRFMLIHDLILTPFIVLKNRGTAVTKETPAVSPTACQSRPPGARRRGSTRLQERHRFAGDERGRHVI
jgi:hypothetical protein